MNTFENAVVYGERIGDLMPALLAAKESMKLEADGMYSGYFELEPEIWAPFRRALLRAEAELMCHDADQLGPPDYESRTDEQRMADAFFRLAVAAGEEASRH